MTKKYVTFSFLALSAFVLSQAAAIGAEICGGQSLCPGYVVGRDNLDAALSKTWEGYPVKDIIPERVQWMMRNYDFRLRLKKEAPFTVHPGLIATTKKYNNRETVSIDPSTGELKNFVAGVPFPDIDASDPLAGTKIIWNLTYGSQMGNGFNWDMAFIFVDGLSGIERIQNWTFTRQRVDHRYLTDKVSLGSPEIFHRTLIYATSPHDIKGLGTFSIRYTTGKLDDIWAYIRTVRRVRRLSGGAWVDPIGGTDWLQDDLQLINAPPTWYSSFRLLGTKKMLFPVDSMGDLIADPKQRQSWRPNEASIDAQFPTYRFNSPPYWNFEDGWELKDLYIIEAIPPKYHPYQKKIAYFDKQTWMGVLAEVYDHKGEYWKTLNYPLVTLPSSDGAVDSKGNPAMVRAQSYGVSYDFQRMHASLFASKNLTVNDPVFDQVEMSYAVLEATGR